MNKTLISTCILSLIFSSCNLIENLIKIPITITDEFTIPAGTGTGTLLNPISENTETNIEEELSNNDSRKDKIKTVELRELKLSIKTSNKDFSFVDDIKIYLKADGEDDKLIASKNNVEATATELSLDVENDELSDYLKQESISFRAQFENKELDLTSTDIEVLAKFRITADIF